MGRKSDILDVMNVDPPSEQDMGPAMLALTEMQRRFVVAMIEIGGSHKRCAIAAGYKYDKENPNSIEVQAHGLAHNPRIQEAIREVGLKMMNAGSLVAVKFVLDTITDVSAEMKDRLKAAEMIMNRSGLHATSEHKVAVTHTDKTSGEMIKQITQLSKVLGVDPQKLLGGAVIEAEFEEVEPEDENNIDDLL